MKIHLKNQCLLDSKPGGVTLTDQCVRMIVPNFAKKGCILKVCSRTQMSYLPTFKFQKEEQMREKNLKRGTFLNFLYITIQRLLQKQEHMIKSFSFLLRKEELFLQKRNSWQVWNVCDFLKKGSHLVMMYSLFRKKVYFCDSQECEILGCR